MPERRVIPLTSPEAFLDACDTAAKQQALTGAISDDVQDDYAKELGQTTVPPLLRLLIAEVRLLRGDVHQIAADFKFKAPHRR